MPLALCLIMPVSVEAQQMPLGDERVAVEATWLGASGAYIVGGRRLNYGFGARLDGLALGVTPTASIGWRPVQRKRYALRLSVQAGPSLYFRTSTALGLEARAALQNEWRFDRLVWYLAPEVDWAGTILDRDQRLTVWGRFGCGVRFGETTAWLGLGLGTTQGGRGSGALAGAWSLGVTF